MVLKPDQERVKTLLRDTITLLCKNGLSFKNKFSIEAVIGVTLDEDDIFLVSLNEIVQSEKPVTPTEDVSARDLNRNHRRRKRKRVKKEGEASGVESISSDDDGGGSFGSPDWDESNSSFNAAESSQPPSKVKRSDNEEDSTENHDDRNRDIMIIKEELQESWSENPINNSTQFSAGGSVFPGMDSQNQSSLLSSMNFGASAPPSGWPQPPTMQSQQLPLAGARTSTVTSEDNSGLHQDDQSLIGQDSQQTTDQQQNVPKGKKKHQCHICGDYFKRPANLRYHVDNHNKEFSIKCPTCGKGFHRKQELRGHFSAKHKTYKDFTCEICGKGFSYPKSLSEHRQREHTDDPNKRYKFYCEMCNKGFNTKWNLKGHMSNKHTGLKDFKCHVCGKGFAYNHALKSHIERHKKRKGDLLDLLWKI